MVGRGGTNAIERAGPRLDHARDAVGSNLFQPNPRRRPDCRCYSRATFVIQYP
jgi:hypothetical protein